MRSKSGHRTLTPEPPRTRPVPEAPASEAGDKPTHWNYASDRLALPEHDMAVAARALRAMRDESPYWTRSRKPYEREGGAS